MKLEPASVEGKQAVRPIVVRNGGRDDHRRHHGGTWKIAYADFVTAMMAFFLLLWLVNATTEQQRTGIAEYFNPTNSLSRSFSGAGQPFGGRTLDSQAALTSNATAAVRNARRPPQSFDPDPEDALQQRTGGTVTDSEPSDWAAHGNPSPESPIGRQAGTGQLAAAALQDAGSQRTSSSGGAGMAHQGLAGDARARGTEGTVNLRPDAARPQPDPSADQRLVAERLALRAAAQEIRAVIDADPQLRALAAQMLVEEVPEGLRIQMVDGEGQALFATGIAAPNERGRVLLLRAASVIAKLSHPVEIAGHTDAAPFRSGTDARSNWELSVERANAARRLMLEAGVTERRVRAVTGRADQDLLRPTQPLHPANRRVSVLIVLNQAPEVSAATMARPAQ
jgi:chemotaxis protein MotB